MWLTPRDPFFAARASPDELMQLLLQTIAEYWDTLGNFFAFDTSLLAEPSMVFRLLLLFGLLFGAACFSGSEPALCSLSRLDLQP